MQTATSPRFIRACRILFAALALAAVITQFVQSVIILHRPPLNFFSYFTFQSNLFAAGVLAWLAIFPSRRSDWIRGAAVLYMLITGAVYNLLLAGLHAQLQTTIPWTNATLHTLMPVVLLFDWLIDPPTARLPFRQALLRWMIYPYLWLAYTLVRGPLAGWYPYPFLNPAQPGGGLTVAAYCVGISLGTFAAIWLVLLLGRRVRLLVS